MQYIKDLPVAGPQSRTSSALPFGAMFAALCASAVLLICWNPIQLSIVTVLLFAGPHNWIEFRYFLGRMPVRWGRSKLFYTFGLGGVTLLAAGYVLLYFLGQSWYLNQSVWTTGISIWNTVMLMWVCSLVYLRGRQSRRDWSWVFAPGLALCAFAWGAPILFNLGLVYFHPFVALWFIDRELKRTKPEWRKTFHRCLALLPLVLIIMWGRLAGAPNLDDSDALSWRIAQHAGAGIFPGLSSHLLVATHVLLETIHYGMWLGLMPFVALGSTVFRTSKIPLAVHRRGWPRTVRLVLACGAFVAVVLWIGFAVDYSTTRDIYFAVAIAHVLAEAPFLIRML
jgi:hypothetical protein